MRDRTTETSAADLLEVIRQSEPETWVWDSASTLTLWHRATSGRIRVKPPSKTLPERVCIDAPVLDVMGERLGRPAGATPDDLRAYAQVMHRERVAQREGSKHGD